MSGTAPAALITDAELAALEAAGLGDFGARLLGRIEHDRQEISWRDSRIDKLTFEMAQLKRVKFGQKTEQLNAEQRALFDEAVDADKLNGHDPYAYLKDVLARLPTHPARDIGLLLPHRWNLVKLFSAN